MKPFATGFFRRPAEVVAHDLLGATIISTLGGARCTGLIVEAEAYLGIGDPASHAWKGRRHAGNASLYGPAGTWYVYRSYGVHWCANLVCGGPDGGAAVLLRGVRPIRGLAVMRRRRGGGLADPRRLADGPGKLCQALGITRALDAHAMAESEVVVGANAQRPAGRVLVTPRIGITKAADWPLRFVLVPEPG